jgi:hypothetical protein
MGDELLDKLRAALSIVRDIYGDEAARDWVEEAQRRAVQWRGKAEGQADIVQMPRSHEHRTARTGRIDFILERLPAEKRDAARRTIEKRAAQVVDEELKKSGA